MHTRKLFALLLAMLCLIGLLAACTEAPAEPEEATIYVAQAEAPAQPEEEASVYIIQTEAPASEEAPEPGTWTLQQIEEALKPQLDFGGERWIDWEVISAERIGVNPEGTTMWIEAGQSYKDISGSVRYRVTVQRADELNYPTEHLLYMFGGTLETFLNALLGRTETQEWDFFIREDGSPELVFVSC